MSSSSLLLSGRGYPPGPNFALMTRMNRRTVVTVFATALLIACSREQAHETKDRAQNAASRTVQKVADTFDASTPLGAREPAPTPQEIEKQRFDQQWRQLQSFRAQEAARVAAAQQQ